MHKEQMENLRRILCSDKKKEKKKVHLHNFLDAACSELEVDKHQVITDFLTKDDIMQIEDGITKLVDMRSKLHAYYNLSTVSVGKSVGKS